MLSCTLTNMRQAEVPMVVSLLLYLFTYVGLLAIALAVIVGGALFLVQRF